MSDLLDDSSIMKEKRGTTLKVLAILSWIAMGLNTVGLLFTLAGGPSTPEELAEEKEAILAVVTPEMLEIVGKEYLVETITILEVTNEMFYSINGINASILIIGFYGVFSMYNLKKKGYYFYIVYSIAPIVVSLAFFGTGFYITLGAVLTGIISATFCILYGAQLKRMS